jgi:hypothetical protein
VLRSWIRSFNFPTPAWRNWQTRWTQKPAIAPRETFAPSHSCEHERTVMTTNDRGTVNRKSTDRARLRVAFSGAFLSNI